MFQKMGLKKKLAMGFGILLALLVITGGYNYVTTVRLIGKVDKANEAMKKKEFSADLELLVRRQRRSSEDFLFAGDSNALQRYESEKQQTKAKLDELSAFLNRDEHPLYGRIANSIEQVGMLLEREIGLQKEGSHKKAQELAVGPQSEAADREMTAALVALGTLERDQVQAAVDSEKDTEFTDEKVTVVLVLFGLVFGVVEATLMSRSITKSMTAMLAMIHEIAENNLAVPDLEIFLKDELGEAGLALNKMKSSLSEVIQSIASTAVHVASASEELSSTAAQQAQGAETQKDQTSQVVTAMQEMATTVMQVSENSNRAAASSKQAADTARQGGAIVDETLTKMRAISESVRSTARKVEELGKSSDQIGRIIGVIDDIADQTNLLALNAAIEAARAGEQGRGFAVVADEVRKLAERTTTATKEIAQMIRTVQEETKTAVGAMEDGTRQVEEGLTTTSQAGDSLKQIIQMSEQVGEMITQIAAAATQQSSATEEINGSMEQIAHLVKESAEGAQQSAKACQDLSGLAMDLQKMVGNFKLEGDGGATRHGYWESGPSNSHLGSSSLSKTKAAGAY
jgi:methyl-accepting chemotaxis protein